MEVKARKSDIAIFTHRKVANTYVFYEMNLWLYIEDADFTLGNSLFGSLKLTKNTDCNKSPYSGWSIGSDTQEQFFLFDGSRFARNVNIRCRYELICAYWQ